MDAAQSLLQKCPPAHLEKNLKALHESILKDNAPALESLAQKYLIPFQVYESADDRPFLLCRYNQKDGRHRSPWTNRWYPKNDSDTPPSDDSFRLFELSMNEVWDAYKNLYYGSEAVGSVYLRDTSDQKGFGPFFGVFGICKQKDGYGTWHSVSTVQVEAASGKDAFDMRTYKVETAVLVVMDADTGDSAGDDKELKMNLSASLSKEATKELKIAPSMLLASHIENIGEMIESNEMDLRTQLERVSIPKTVEMVDTLMKEKTKSFKPPGVNPLMGMIMDSNVLKKKLAKQG